MYHHPPAPTPLTMARAALSTWQSNRMALFTACTTAKRSLADINAIVDQEFLPEDLTRLRDAVTAARADEENLRKAAQTQNDRLKAAEFGRDAGLCIPDRSIRNSFLGGWF